MITFCVVGFGSHWWREKASQSFCLRFEMEGGANLLALYSIRSFTRNAVVSLPKRLFYWTKLPLNGSRNYINNQSSVWCREEATQCRFHSQKRWPPSSVLQHLSLCCAPTATFSQPKPDSANPNPFSYHWKPKHGLHSHSLNT